ncbi:hypothetical protein [Corynebacterium glutamicum]|uniref:hypothetical protein n=1 Tax=Corynebacterium glutamicum TaxID=1718 RepID=UPI000943D302|nr:hypothetical protein [Corynebacterium glutamicum]OKX85139.1 hypothetical protein AUO95_00980 [Corynebacterium glutamicum]
MTRVHGDLWLVTDDPAGVNQVVVRAPDLRTRNGGAVTTLPKTEPVTGGKIDITVLPGPAYLTPVSYGRLGEAIPIVVPDAESATLESVIQAAEIADTTQRDILEEIAAQVTADREAVAADRQAAAESADGAKESEEAAAQSAQQAQEAVNTPGRVGPPANITVGTVSKLDPGTAPTVELVGEAPDFTMNLGLTTGERGLPGQVGITTDTAGVTRYDPVVIDLRPHLLEGVTAGRFSLTVSGSTATLSAYDVKNSNSGAQIFPASKFPAEYRPKADLAGPCFIREGTATATTNSAFWAISAAGSMNHWRSGGGSNGYVWTATWAVEAPVLHANTGSIMDGSVTPEKLSQAYATPTYVDNAVSERVTPDTAAMMISQAIAGLVGSAPQALDTVYELAAYLTDPGVASGLVQQLAGKAPTSHKHDPSDINGWRPYSSHASQAGTVPWRATGGHIMLPPGTPPSGAATSREYVDQRPAFFYGPSDPPSSIPGAVKGDTWLNTVTKDLFSIDGV